MDTATDQYVLPPDFLSKAFEQLNEAACILDPAGMVLFVNHAFEEMLGWKQSELVNKPIHDVLHRHDRGVPARCRLLEEILTGESLSDGDDEFVRKNDTVFPVLYTLTPVQQSKKVMGFVLTFRDMTVKKRVEKELIRNEKLFHTMADCANILFWFFNAAGELVYINKLAIDFVGVSLDEFLSKTGRSYGNFIDTSVGEFMHPDDVPGAVEELTKAFENRTQFVFENRWLYHHKDYRWVLQMGGPVISEDGEFFGFVGSSVDIHERKMLEEALARYTQRLERSNKELEQFAFLASHDLQEPLRKVMMFSEHLKTTVRDILPAEALDDLERIQRATSRMQRLISDLLDLSRVTRRGQPLKPTDMNKVLREVLADLSYKIRETKARVEMDDLPVIEADSQQMHQLFFQLLDNALKFHKPDVPPVVKLQTHFDGDTCQIVISDNGIGIKAEQLDKIFGAFVRLHHEKSIEGTGIGLSLVQRIAERHGGLVSVESEVQEGTKFTVSLPLSQR
jgi:PAS domain S-box-containing protein